MNHAVHIATKGYLGSLTTYGYIVDYVEVEYPGSGSEGSGGSGGSGSSEAPPSPPTIPYFAGGGGNFAVGTPQVVDRKAQKDDKAIKVTFVYKGKEYEHVGLISSEIFLMLDDLVLLEVDDQPVVAIKMRDFKKVSPVASIKQT